LCSISHQPNLMAGRVRVRALTAAAVDIARLPRVAPPAEAEPPTPLAELLKPPHLPVAVERLAIDRLSLDPALFGDPVTASLSGNASIALGEAQAELDLHRTDGTAGSLALRLGPRGAPANLTLTADGGRADRRVARACAASRRSAAAEIVAERRRAGRELAGSVRSVGRRGGQGRADLKVAARAETAVAINGFAEVARLLPPEFAPLLGERLPIDLHLTARENGAIAIDDLTVALASGSMTGTALSPHPIEDRRAASGPAFPILAMVKSALVVEGRGSARGAPQSVGYRAAAAPRIDGNRRTIS